MYTLLSGLYAEYSRKTNYCVLIVGLDNAGKTTFLQTAKGIFSNKVNKRVPAPTVGLNMDTLDVDNVTITVWDLGGQEELRSLWDKYYSECHALIFVVDAFDRDHIEDAKKEFQTVVNSQELKGVPLLLIANKQDLPDCMGVREVRPLFHDQSDAIGNREFMALPTSGLSGDGVEEGILWLVDAVKRNAEKRPPRED